MRPIRLCLLLSLSFTLGCQLDGTHIGTYPGWVKDMNIYDLPPNLAAQTCFLVGSEFEKQRQWDDALQYFEQAQALDPLLPDIHSKLAHVSEKVGNPEQAAAYHREACKAKPLDAQVHLDAGRFFARTDANDDALHHLQESARLEPNRREVWDDLGKTLAKQDRTGDAMLVFLRIYPEEEARLRIGLVLFESGRKSEGREIVEAALNANPSLGKFAPGVIVREPKKRLLEPNPIQTVGFEEKPR